jgi:GTP cyclohydrolase I
MIERLIHDLLTEIGEDPTREGLEKTPARVAKAWEYFTSGYKQDVHEVLNEALFTEEYDEMVVVKDIDLYSICEHHLLPFVGKCHIAYMPSRKIVGLSKLPRLVEMFARRVLADLLQEVVNEPLDHRGVTSSAWVSPEYSNTLLAVSTRVTRRSTPGGSASSSQW